MNSFNLKPLSCKDNNLPPFSISNTLSPKLLRCLTPSSPKKSNSPAKLNQLDSYNEKLKGLGDLEFISKEKLIDNFNTKYFTMGFWTSIQTKTLGTFLVVTSPDSKMHFVGMRHKLFGCNFQYNFEKNNICANNCTCCDLNSNFDVSETLYYEFPNEVIILTPNEPYQVPKILSKM